VNEWQCPSSLASRLVPAITVKSLTKSYGDVTAVRGIDLSIDEGEVFALLGPNGAGKTTTVEILEGHRERDAGEVSVLGTDPATAGREFRERIGVVLQTSGMDRQLTVRESLKLYRAMYPRRYDADRVIEIVGLEDKADARISTLSGGQQRRVDLGLGIIGRPELIFLDEPTTGFDPSARRKSWELIDRLRSLGTTILLTTHYMDEAQHLADRVAVIADGRIVAEGSPDTLGSRTGTTTRITFRLDPGSPAPPAPFAATGRGFSAAVDDATRVLHDITSWAIDLGVSLHGISVSRPSLEDVYLELTDE